MAWQTTVDFLMHEFRACLVDLTPHMDKLRIAWKEHTYDDWDSIAEALYTNVVLRSIEYAQETGADWTDLKLAQYGFYNESYLERSFIALSSEQSSTDEFLAFIEFTTFLDPFDGIAFQRLIGPDLKPAGPPEIQNGRRSEVRISLK